MQQILLHFTSEQMKDNNSILTIKNNLVNILKDLSRDSS